VLPSRVQVQKEAGRKLRAMAAQMDRDERLIAEMRGAAAEAQAHAQRCEAALHAAEGRLRDIETRGRGEKAVDATPAVADAATTTATTTAAAAAAAAATPVVMVARAPSRVPSSPQQPQQQPQPQPQQPQQQQAQQPLPQQEQQHSLQAEREWEERRAMQVRPI